MQCIVNIVTPDYPLFLSCCLLFNQTPLLPTFISFVCVYVTLCVCVCVYLQRSEEGILFYHPPPNSFETGFLRLVALKSQWYSCSCPPQWCGYRHRWPHTILPGNWNPSSDLHDWALAQRAISLSLNLSTLEVRYHSFCCNKKPPNPIT